MVINIEFYGFTRKNNSSVVITIPSKLNLGAEVYVRVVVDVVPQTPFQKVEESRPLANPLVDRDIQCEERNR